MILVISARTNRIYMFVATKYLVNYMLSNDGCVADGFGALDAFAIKIDRFLNPPNQRVYEGYFIL